MNMPSIQYAVDRIKDIDVCLGLDINCVAGKSITDHELIPHITKPDGSFYNSKEVIGNNKLIRRDGLKYIFENDPYPYGEILLETENQVKRFIELTGRKPEYLHGHSICTPNMDRAAREIAKKYNLYYTFDMIYSLHALNGVMENVKGLSLEKQINANVVDDMLNTILPSAVEDSINYFIFYCGYVDAKLFEESSLTLRRMKDLEAATDKRVLQYIEKHNIKFVTYRDLR